MSKCILFNNKKRCLPGAYSVIGKREYSPEISGGIVAFNKKNIELKDIGNIINNRENGNYKYTIYLLCGENIPIAKRAFNIDITDSDKGKTPYFYINPGKNYGFEVYRESPNGKKEVVVGFSSVNDMVERFFMGRCQWSYGIVFY